MHLLRCKPLAVALVVAGTLLLAGCLPFPLGSPENSTVDNKLAGDWFSQDEDSQTLITLYPFDAHTYVVHTADFKKDDKHEPLAFTISKAWLTTVKTATFITIEPLAQRLPGGTKDEKPTFVVLRLMLTGDGLTFKGVDADFAPMKAVKSSEDVAKVIAENLDNPKLYRDNVTHCRHLDPEKDAEILGPLIQRRK